MRLSIGFAAERIKPPLLEDDVVWMWALFYTMGCARYRGHFSPGTL